MIKFDPLRKKTYTLYWNNFSKKPKKFQSTHLFFKKIKKIIRQLFPYYLKLRVQKNKVEPYERFTSFQTDTKILSYRNSLLSETVINFLKKSKIKFLKASIPKFVNEYCKVFSNTPILDLNSGFGFNEGLYLFCIIKVVKPTLVIESGIMKGFTTYLIDAASDKNCTINCYDISFENIEYKSKKAIYFQNDINKTPPNFKNQKVLAFWDDHTSQLDRLEFSIKNNIKYNIFDDDLGFLNFHSDGWPPIPSITMLYEIQNKILKQEKIKWISRGRQGELWINSFSDNNAIKNIFTHTKFTNLFPYTGYKNHSECSFVKLK
jgi:hypothetical protein